MKLIVLDFDRGDCFVYTNFDETDNFSAEDYLAHLGHIIENCQWMFGDVDIHENKTPGDIHENVTPLDADNEEDDRYSPHPLNNDLDDR